MSWSDAELRRVARLYYVDDQKQATIAREVGTSRTTVSRLLAEARRRGVVTIAIDDPVELDHDRSLAVRRRFDLREAIVVAAPGDQTADPLRRVAAAAADLVAGLLRNEITLGVSWGRTMSEVVAHLDPPAVRGALVVQLTGALGRGLPAVDGPDVARRLSERIGGRYRTVPAPAVVESAQLCEGLRRQPVISAALVSGTEADICLSSVGSLDDSSLERNGYLDAEERRSFKGRGAVGHVLAHLVDADGNPVDDYNRRVISVPLEALRDCPWSICVASGEIKAAPVRAAIAGGYVNSVVIDQPIADRLLA